jgi:hypothetical protein
MKILGFIYLFLSSLFLYSQNETIEAPTVEKTKKYDISINYGISFQGKDYHTHTWEDSFASYSKPGIDVRAIGFMKIWKNSGILISYHFLKNDFDFEEIKQNFEQSSDIYEWEGVHSKWVHNTLYVGFSTEVKMAEKFNFIFNIQPGLSHSKSPSYKIVGKNPNDFRDFYIYQQFSDMAYSFALTTGLGLKYIFNKTIYSTFRSDFSFFSPEFEIEVNNDGSFYYKSYTPYITSFSISVGVGVKF